MNSNTNYNGLTKEIILKAGTREQKSSSKYSHIHKNNRSHQKVIRNVKFELNEQKATHPCMYQTENKRDKATYFFGCQIDPKRAQTA